MVDSVGRAQLASLPETALGGHNHGSTSVPAPSGPHAGHHCVRGRPSPPENPLLPHSGLRTGRTGCTSSDLTSRPGRGIIRVRKGSSRMGDTLAEWRDHAVAAARTLLERDGRLQPVVLLWRRPKGGAPGDEAIVLMRFTTPREKDIAARKTRRIARRIRAEAALHISECWRFPEGADELALVRQGYTPGTHPQRREAVVITLEAEGVHQMAMVPIERTGGKVTCGEPAWENPGPGKLIGRFVGWLPSPQEGRN